MGYFGEGQEIVFTEPVFKKEGFSPHAIEGIFKRDLEELGPCIEVDGDMDNLHNGTMIYLSEDVKFRSFLKKNLKIS